MDDKESLAALEDYIILRDAISDLEDYYEDSCSCDLNEFHRCEFCRNVGEKESKRRELLERYGDSWAIMLAEKEAICHG